MRKSPPLPLTSPPTNTNSKASHYWFIIKYDRNIHLKYQNIQATLGWNYYYYFLVISMNICPSPDGSCGIWTHEPWILRHGPTHYAIDVDLVFYSKDIYFRLVMFCIYHLSKKHQFRKFSERDNWIITFKEADNRRELPWSSVWEHHN